MSTLMGVGAGAFAIQAALGAPAIFFDDLASGRDQFNTTVTSADPSATVTVNPLNGLTGGTVWDAGGGLTITATGGNMRTINDNYLQTSPSLVANGETTGQGIEMTAAQINGSFENSGLTFTFAQPVNAFGLELGDWGTCCYPSSMYVQFDNNPPIEVGTANARSDTGEVNGSQTYTFIGAIDDSATFSTVRLFGTGSGDVLYAGGTMLYANVALNAVSGPVKIDTAQPSYDETEAPALADPVTFAGGTFRPTADMAWNQDVVIESTNGFIDPNGHLVAVNGDISGAGKLTVDGGGVVALAGENSFTGGLEVDGGTVQVSQDANLGTGPVTVGAATVEATGSFATDNDFGLTDPAATIDTGTHTVAISGDVTGTGALNKDGTGTLTLSGANTFSGGLNIDQGTVRASADANLGTGAVTIGAAALQAGGSFATNNAVVLTDTASVIDSANNTLTVSGNITGNGALNKSGVGMLVLSGNNTFSGGLRINAGTVQASADANVGASPITIGAGTLQAGADFATNNALVLTSSQAAINTGTHTLTLASDITGTGALTKRGSGSLILSGPNTFSGGLNIAGGTVQVADDPNLGTGTVSVGPGTLRTTGSFTTDNNFALTDSAAAIDTNGNALRILGSVAGNGALNKQGGGTLTLAGANTFSGGLNINAGTLEAADDSNLGASPISLGDATFRATGTFATNNGFVLTNPHATIDTGVQALTISGNVSGTGALNKTGNGILDLTGQNSFSGGLAVAGGTVRVADDPNLGAGTVSIGPGTLRTTGSFTTDNAFAVTDSAAAIDTNGNTIRILGDIAGNGALNKQGGGTLTLAGANTFSGGLNLEAGTVEASSDANLGVGAVSIGDATLKAIGTFSTDNAIEVTDPSSTIDTDIQAFTVAGNISGNGTLNKDGTGTLRLLGDNSQDGVHLLRGTIEFDSDAALGRADGAVTLESGTTLSPLADLTLTHDLQVNGDNAAIDTGGHDIMLTGTTAGTSCLNKRGTGRLDLQADGSNDIGACVHEGRLDFNAGFTGNLWVYAGGTAGGDGTLYGDAEIRGTLSPGNSPGRLVVVGDVTQMAGSRLDVDIDGRATGIGAGKFDTLVLTGAGSVYTADGTIAPRLRGISAPANNTFTPRIGDTFAVVTAEGGVKGSFDAVDQPTAGMPANSRFDTIYTDNQVILAVTPKSYSVALGRSGLDNAVMAAEALDGVRPDAGGRNNTATGRFFTGLIGLNGDALASTFQQVSGEIHADAMSSAYQASRMARSAVTERLTTLSGGGTVTTSSDDSSMVATSDAAVRRNLWAQLTGQHSDVDADGTARGYEATSKGIAGGIDGFVTDSLVVGIAGTIAETDTDAGAQGKSNLNSYEGLAYASLLLDGNYLNAIAGVSFDDYDIDRHVNLSTGTRDLEADTNGRTYSLDAEAGRRMDVGRVAFTPAAGLSWDRITRDGVTEKGGSAVALSFDDESRDAVQARIGSRISTAFEVGGALVEARAEAFYLHEFGDNRSELDPSLHGASFSSDSPDAGSNGVRLGVGAVANVSQFVQVFADYRAEIWSDSTDQSVRGGVTVKW